MLFGTLTVLIPVGLCKMLSPGEAEEFVRISLKVPSELCSKREQNQIEFLNSVVRAAHVYLPFQNLTLIATEPRCRRK